MSTAIIIPVQRAIFEFESVHGKKPTKLLLGKREKRWMDQYVKCYVCVFPIKGGPSRGKFHGLEVYEMDDDKFLAVV